MVDGNKFTYSKEDVERIRKLYDSAASPEEISVILNMPMMYVNKIVSLIRKRQI